MQLLCEELPYDLVSLAKTEELPDGCTRNAWERLTSEYDLTEGEDKITLLSMYQQKKDKAKVRGFKCRKLGHYANECKNEKETSGNEKHVTFAMMCCENSEEEKYENDTANEICPKKVFFTLIKI